MVLAVRSARTPVGSGTVQVEDPQRSEFWTRDRFPAGPRWRDRSYGEVLEIGVQGVLPSNPAVYTGKVHAAMLRRKPVIASENHGGTRNAAEPDSSLGGSVASCTVGLMAAPAICWLSVRCLAPARFRPRAIRAQSPSRISPRPNARGA